MIWYKESPSNDPLNFIYSSPKWLKDYDNPIHEFPLIVDLETTNICNLNCRFCSRQLISGDKGFISWDVYTKVIDEASRYGAALRISGWGEPLLHKDCVNQIKYASEKGMITKIYTNGISLTEKMAYNLMSASLGELQFSMQGLSPSQYEDIRLGANYKRLRNAVKMAHDIREKNKFKTFLSILTSIMSGDLDEYPEEKFMDDWKEFMDKIAIDITNFNWVKDLQEVTSYLKKQLLGSIHVPCVDIFLKIAVAWDGNILFCPNQYDHDPEFTLGNVKDISLYEAWHSEKFEKHRNEVGRNTMHDSKPFCRNCFVNTTKYDELKKKLSEGTVPNDGKE